MVILKIVLGIILFALVVIFLWEIIPVILVIIAVIGCIKIILDIINR